mmetsp:Transcript_112987/g.269335  ORF Transcript_112987/g.269335 Transcript_112987/m.269335 type:complete len:200 (-) Transcript_112987:995-1594(-)
MQVGLPCHPDAEPEALDANHASPVVREDGMDTGCFLAEGILREEVRNEGRRECFDHWQDCPGIDGHSHAELDGIPPDHVPALPHQRAPEETIQHCGRCKLPSQFLQLCPPLLELPGHGLHKGCREDLCEPGLLAHLHLELQGLLQFLLLAFTALVLCSAHPLNMALLLLLFQAFPPKEGNISPVAGKQSALLQLHVPLR